MMNVKWLFIVCLLVTCCYAEAQHEADKLTETGSYSRINPIFPSRGKPRPEPNNANGADDRAIFIGEDPIGKRSIALPPLPPNQVNQRSNNFNTGTQSGRRRRIQKRIIRRPKSRRRSQRRRITTTTLPPTTQFSVQEQYDNNAYETDNPEHNYLPTESSIMSVTHPLTSRMQFVPSPNANFNNPHFGFSKPLHLLHSENYFPISDNQAHNSNHHNPFASLPFAPIDHSFATISGQSSQNFNQFTNIPTEVPNTNVGPFSSAFHDRGSDVISLSPIPEHTLSRSLKKAIDQFGKKTQPTFTFSSNKLRTEGKFLESGIIGAFAGLAPPSDDSSTIIRSRQLNPARTSSRQGRNREINTGRDQSRHFRSRQPSPFKPPIVIHQFQQPEAGNQFEGANIISQIGPTVGNSIFVNPVDSRRGTNSQQNIGRIDLDEGSILIHRERIPFNVEFPSLIRPESFPQRPFNQGSQNMHSFGHSFNMNHRVNSGSVIHNLRAQLAQTLPSRHSNDDIRLQSFKSRDRHRQPIIQNNEKRVFNEAPELVDNRRQRPNQFFFDSNNRQLSGSRRTPEHINNFSLIRDTPQFSTNQRERHPNHPISENTQDQSISNESKQTRLTEYSFLGHREQLNRNQINPVKSNYAHKFGPAFTTIHGGPGQRDIVISDTELTGDRQIPDISYNYQPDNKFFPATFGGQTYLPFTSPEVYNQLGISLSPLLPGEQTIQSIHHNDINLSTSFASNQPPTAITEPFSFFPYLRPTVGRPNLIPKKTTHNPNSFSNLIPETPVYEDISVVTYRPHVTAHQQEDISFTTFDNTQIQNQRPSGGRFPQSVGIRPTFPDISNNPSFDNSGTTQYIPFLGTDINNDRQYAYGYAVNAPSTGDNKAAYEIKGPDGVVRGQYSLMQPDGQFRVVTYRADKDNGFRADVKYYKR